MPNVTHRYRVPHDLLLGIKGNRRVHISEQVRQRREVEEILKRLRRQSGVVLADEVGMGKTFVALAVAYAVAVNDRRGPVVVMVPPNLMEKWEQDLSVFRQLYLPEGSDLRHDAAYNSVQFLKLMDDPRRERRHIVFVTQGAMSRRQTDKWVRLALIRQTLRRHGRQRRLRLVKKQIHRFLAQLLRAGTQQYAATIREEIWQELLATPPREWKATFNAHVRNDRHRLDDDPVPAAVARVLKRTDLRAFAAALAQMPVRARGGQERVSERIAIARDALITVERELWNEILARAPWKSPLLVLDEAHHLKNPSTALARQLQSPEADEDLKVGDGALARSFDRMLFLTATPFQLGHYELLRVLQRFGDVRWDRRVLGDEETFRAQMEALGQALTAAQRAAVRLHKAWSNLRPDEAPRNLPPDEWWRQLQNEDPEQLPHRPKALVEAYGVAKARRADAEQLLRPWVVRHNKGEHWHDTGIPRRDRRDGARMLDGSPSDGLDIPGEQLLPFFLAARSATEPGQDLLGEALCSSYEAFRFTRRNNCAGKDDLPSRDEAPDLTQSRWFLEQFDAAIDKCSGDVHPKMRATIAKAADLWEAGEKVLVFAFYRETCAALRVHISALLERRLRTHARRRLAGAGRVSDDAEIDRILTSIQSRYFDTPESPGRRALNTALGKLLTRYGDKLDQAQLDRETLQGIMRRFLRVRTTLVRAFPIHELESLAHHRAVRSMLDREDDSHVSWRRKFSCFIDFLLECSPQERQSYLDAAARTQTGSIRVQYADTPDDLSGGEREVAVKTLANVQVATGATSRTARARLMRAFNTPFFPDILVCSQVMGEGVDLHRHCRHVIHHDLDWNPSSIEQRTGRVDRIGCKAEGEHPIVVYLPYLAGTADERQYRVMSDRERWFRIVMGQDEVAALIPEDLEGPATPPPPVFYRTLAFHLAPGNS